MKIRFSIFLAAVGFFISTFFGCSSASDIDTSPRDIVGIFKYTGATYMPVHISAPYRYAVYDINGVFVAYVDTSKIVVPQTNPYLGKLVEVHGAVTIIDGENVLIADYIRLMR